MERRVSRRLALVFAAMLGVILASATASDSPLLTPPGNRSALDPACLLAGADDRWLATTTRTIATAEYEASPSAAGLQAPNRAQAFRTTFAGSGIAIVPREASGEPGWRFAWRLARLGRPGAMAAVESATPTANGARVIYARPALREWYENTARGLEQGFEVPVAPPGTGPLQLEGELGDGLRAELDRAAGAIDFVDRNGAGVLRYAELVVRDAAGGEVPAKLALAGNTLTIEIADAGATYPITIDPLMSSPAWTVEANQELAQLGCSVATAGDVNGDGFSDVAVGAYAFDNGQANEGRVFLYLGSAAGLATSPVWTAESDQAGGFLGISVAPAGDVNGDGFSDLIAGANLYDNGQTDEGRAVVYHGSPTGLGAAPAWTVESDQAGASFGASVATAGDVNGDGFVDVIVGAIRFDNGETDEGRAFVYLGSASGLATTPAWTTESNQATANYGIAVASAGDVNGDRFADVIVGAWQYSNGQLSEGRAFVYHGSGAGLATTPAWTTESDQIQGFLGVSVATAGDVNADGFSDVLVGAFSYDHGESNEGMAFLYQGSATGLATVPAWTGEGNLPGAFFGESVATAGDVTGDGFADVIIGADGGGTNDEGRVYVYQGSASGLGATPVWTAESDQDDAHFGYSAATAGDVNGDGFSDVIVGAYLFDNGTPDEGRAFVYHGSPAGLAPAASWTVESNQAVAFLGWLSGVKCAGDVNGDGYSDVIASAYLFDNGQSEEGRAFLYQGSAAGLSLVPSWTAESNQANAQFGISVASAGDVNGDGYSDVIVGADGATNGQAGEGRAFVYHGSPAGLSAAPAWSAEANQADARFGNAVSAAGDVNGDGFADVVVGALQYDNGQSDEGRAFVYLGSPGGLGLAPAWTAESDQALADFGFSVAGAGDVNGDGFSDVIIGADQFDNGQDQEGRAYVYHGSPAGLRPLPAWVTETNQIGGGFAMAVGSAGDVDGNGFSDVIVGTQLAENGQQDEGTAAVYLGSAAGLATIPNWVGESNQAGAHFGLSVGTAGDVNADGYSDIIVSAIDFDNSQFNEGRAFVYLGSPTGINLAPTWTAESDQVGAEFGSSVAAAGDVNGDGFGDVVVGCHGFDNGQVDEGRIFAYYGNAGGGLDRAPRQARVDNTAPIDVLGRSDSETGFRLKALGRTPAGRGRVRLEVEIERFGVPFDAAGVLAGPFFDTGAPGPGGSAVQVSQHPGGLDPSTLYHWRLRVATDSPFFPHTLWLTLPLNAAGEADLRTAGVSLAVAAEAPRAGAAFLEPVHPNPFRGVGEIAYQLPQAARVRLSVVDVAGRTRRVIVEAEEAAGRHVIPWNGEDASGARLPRGVYLLRLEAGDLEATRKIALSR